MPARRQADPVDQAGLICAITTRMTAALPGCWNCEYAARA
jgi:hypothetical protein